LVFTHRVSGVSVRVLSGVAVGSNRNCAIRLIGESLGDDINCSRNSLRSIKQGLPPLDDLHSLDHTGGNGIEGRRACVEAIVDTHAIHEPQDILSAGTLE